MKYIVSILFVVTMASCTTIKSLEKIQIPKGTYLVKLQSENVKVETIVDTADISISYFQIYTTNDLCSATIDISESKTEIEILDTSKIDKLKKISTNKNLNLEDDTKFKIPYQLQYKGKLEEIAKDSVGLYINKDTKGGVLSIGEKFKYWKIETIEQAITIPFKIRPRLNERPYELTTGINAGFAYGLKWDWNNTRSIFKNSNKNRIGYKNQTKSLVLSPFIGLAANALNTANTNNELENSRNILGVNYGFTVVVGINRFDFGVAVGKDFGFGDVVDSWVYQNETWYGLVLGLELFD